MAYNLFNHIQGKNGSRWVNFIREIGSEHLLLVAVDAAKYTHKSLISNFYGEILVGPRDPVPVTARNMSNESY